MEAAKSLSRLGLKIEKKNKKIKRDPTKQPHTHIVTRHVIFHRGAQTLNLQAHAISSNHSTHKLLVSEIYILLVLFSSDFEIRN
jgi:hypothetical protein